MNLEDRAREYRRLTTAEMRSVVGDAPDALFAWMRYHLGWEDRDGQPSDASPGKMMRPVGVMLSADLVGGAPQDVAAAAAAIELVHNFSLLHDDVEDRSEFRRGRANLWTFAGTAQAINTGDGMFTLARLAAHRLEAAGHSSERVLAAMREIDEACIRLVHGQYLDISFEERDDVSLDEYLAMAGGKTAAMFAAPFAVGALLGGADEAAVDALRRYGRHVGIAFQMVDDILGIWGDPAVTGKPASDDLSSRKMTYPVIAALLAEGNEAFRHAYAQRPTPDDDLLAMADAIERSGARTRTEAMARAEEQAAMEAVRAAGLDDAALTLLAEYAEAAIGRVS